MPVTAIGLTRSRNAAGDLVVRLGVLLLDEYLEFLAGRCRPNTVLAVAYDLKVFFTVAGKPPRRVRPVDVLAFMTAQRAGGEGRLQASMQIRRTRSKASTAPPRSPSDSLAQPRSSSVAPSASGRGQVTRIAAARSRSCLVSVEEALGVRSGFLPRTAHWD